jgi:hypothetical protein
MASALDRSSCLYHYTSATGLESILRQRLLRATDTGFLNDLKEIIYATEPLIPRLDDLLEIVAAHDAKYDQGQKIRSSIVRSARDAIKRFTHLDKDMPPPSPGQYRDGATYVACLTEDHDQLGQWRGYGQEGYAIGLRKAGLKAMPGELRRVLYGDSGVDATCEEIVEYLRTQPLSAHPGTRGYFDALSFCMPRIAAVKHAAFEQELEWRLIVSNYGGSAPPVKVRTSPLLIPYVELRFEQSCVAEIVIGPGGHSHSERAVRAALRANNYDPNGVQITQSTAPFRG